MSITARPAVVLRGVSIIAIASATALADAGGPSTRPVAPDRFHYAGDVVDERGTPVADATVTATIRRHDSDGYSYIDRVATDAAGHFEIDRAVAMSGLPRSSLNADAIVSLECNDAAHLVARREDLASLSAEALGTLRLSMKDGKTQAGTVVDPAGRPVADALVRVTFDDEDWLAGKGSITDAAGRFAIRGLPERAGSLSALARQAGGSLQATATPLPATGADAITLTVAPVPVAAADVRDVMGMKLAPLDASTADALGRHGQSGVLVLDPGHDVARFHLGEVRAGDVFWLVGDKEVKTVDEFRRGLLNAKQPPAGVGGATCRVVYRFRRADFDGTNTQSMLLTAADLSTLRPIETKPAE